VKYKIFISSVQKEFVQQRLDLKAFLLGDAVLRRFVSEVFLFEEIPARDRRADEHQKLTGAIKKTASRDLDDLTQKGIFTKVGVTGRGTYYRLARKGDIKGTKGTFKVPIDVADKGDKKGTLDKEHGKGSKGSWDKITQ